MARQEEGDSRTSAVDFRHLSAFQRVYQEKSYAHAGQSIFATRKSIVRMMQNLERSFDTPLFSEGLRGELIPGPFAERLFNDLRFLNAARHRMKDHITAIHENGRVLHVGSSPAVFRTREFRNLFRGLQSLDGIRACYSAVDPADAGRALVSGHCDLYLGCQVGTASRFVIQEAGSISFRIYRRGEAGAGEPQGRAHQVSLDGKAPEPPVLSEGGRGWNHLDEAAWLHWLDRPEECPLGTIIFAPDVEMDREFWQPEEIPEAVAVHQPLHASFLRQHAYEFLPALMSKLRTRIPAS